MKGLPFLIGTAAAAAASALTIIMMLVVISDALPSGFEDQSVARVNEVVDIAFTVGQDNLIMFAITKPGELFALTGFETENPTSHQTLSLDLDSVLCGDGERG
jgi:hypothetical protein